MNFPRTVFCPLFIIFMLLPEHLFAASKEQTTSYLKQETIDTTVMKGFYVLTEAANIAGIGFRQQEAIQTAKRLAKDLRDKAKNDPNARYILWKVGELEAQIYLEEQDLTTLKKQQGQITVNSWIARYNAEVGKPRPDFSTLKRIHTELAVLDQSKANEISDSYNKRYRSISREVMFSIEKAVLSGDHRKARDELGYCLRNKNYLCISNSQYYQMESRVDGLTNAYAEKPFIEKETDSAGIYIQHQDFNNARTMLFSAQYRLKNVNQYFPQAVSQKLSSQISRFTRQLAMKEDSLVSKNIAILSRQGINAADEFLQKVLKPCGVAREKTAYVDSMILVISSPQKNSISKEFEELPQTNEQTQQTSVFDDIRQSAQKKAQARADSVRIANEIILQRALAERLRDDSILAANHDAQVRELQKHQEQANALTMNIYDLVDKNRGGEAEKMFLQQQYYLKQYLPPEMYEVLDMTINALKTPAEPQKVAYITPVVAPASVQPAGTMPTLSTAESEKMRKNQERAQQEIIGIYSMLENNQTLAAYNKFQSIRTPLKKYLPGEAFDALETIVMQSMQHGK